MQSTCTTYFAFLSIQDRAITAVALVEIFHLQFFYLICSFFCAGDCFFCKARLKPLQADAASVTFGGNEALNASFKYKDSRCLQFVLSTDLTAFTPKLLQAKIVIYFNFNSNLIHHPVRTGPDSKAVVFN